MRAKEIARDVFWLPLGIANVYFVGRPGKPWVLIDAAMPGHGWQIRAAADLLYGEGARPQAILLTHGHRDHSGSAKELADAWDVPIFVHALERPFVTGTMYPPGDPTVGGFLAMLSRFVRLKPIDLGERVRTLESTLDTLGLDDWNWHHTPGHAPGHVAFFRRSDGTLIAGDAITTVNLDSALAIATQQRRVSGPPSPFTYDWRQARESARFLAELWPDTIASGHGKPMSGSQVVQQLADLATDFPIPLTGRYVGQPAQIDAMGNVSLPAKPPDFLPHAAVALSVATAAGAMAAVAAQRRRRRKMIDAKADTPVPAS